MIEPVDVLDAGNAHVTGTWRDVAFIVWRDAVSALLVVDQVNRVVDWASHLGGHFAVVVVVEPKTALPGPAARVELVAGLKRLAPQLRAAGLLLEGEGFWVASVRGVIAGMNAVTPRNHPKEVFSTADEVATFVTEHMGYDQASRALLVEALQHLRAVPRPSAPQLDGAGAG